MVKIDCRNLILEMAGRGVTARDLAFLLGEEEETILSRMRGTSEWVYSEAVTIRNALFPECELGYLFQEKRQDA